MKNFKLAIFTVAALLSATIFQSCDKEEENYSYYALVTAKQAADNTFFLQLDENTTLLPKNIKQSPFGNKEVRALVNFTDENEKVDGYNKMVYVNWIDSIRTKGTVENMGDKNDSVYGYDPVEIYDSWVTIVEDGYLTLRFRTIWGYTGIPHHINLLTNVNPQNPYEVELRHDAKGDIAGRWGDGLVAFDLSKLPDTEGKTVKLKLNWLAFGNIKKSVEFDYCTRKSTQTGKMKISDEHFITTIE